MDLYLTPIPKPVCQNEGTVAKPDRELSSSVGVHILKRMFLDLGPESGSSQPQQEIGTLINEFQYSVEEQERERISSN